MLVKSLSKKFYRIVKWLFIVVFFLTVFYFLNEFFLVKEIKIENKISVVGLKEIRGRSIIFLKENELEKFFIEKNPLIESIKIKKIFPSTLQIIIKPEEPLAQLTAEKGFFYLSSEGKILFKTKTIDQRLTVINYYQKLNYQSFKPGDFLTFNDLKKTLILIDEVKKIGFNIVNVDINGVNMILFNLGDKNIIFSEDKDIEEQIYQCQQIVKQFKLKGKSYKEIDLRYDKPIVRF